jgi:hypothetical protein
MSKRKSFVQNVWKALHPAQRYEERRWLPRRVEPRWKRLEAQRREERRLARTGARRLSKRKYWTHMTPDDWEALAAEPARRRAEGQRLRIETLRLKQEAGQRFGRDRAVLREKRRRAERAKVKTIPRRVTRRYGHRHRSVWVPTPILERPWVKLLAEMVPGRWYSRADLWAIAPDVALNWAYGAGRPYLDRGRKTTPDMKHPPGFLSHFRLNAKGEALRAAFLAAKPEGA